MNMVRNPSRFHIRAEYRKSRTGNQNPPQDIQNLLLNKIVLLFKMLQITHTCWNNPTRNFRNFVLFVNDLKM